MARIGKARRSGAAAIEVLQRRSVHFVRPDPECLQYVRAKRRNERDIRRVAPAGDGDAANARRIVARVESEPASIEKDFKPRVIVHRCRVGRHANVTQKSIRVTRRNIHAAAESDCEMGEIAADADALLIGFKSGAGRAGVFVAEGQMTADEIADRLNPAPAARA